MRQKEKPKVRIKAAIFRSDWKKKIVGFLVEFIYSRGSCDRVITKERLWQLHYEYQIVNADYYKSYFAPYIVSKFYDYDYALEEAVELTLQTYIPNLLLDDKITDKSIVSYVYAIISDEENQFRYSPECKGYVAPEKSYTYDELDSLESWLERRKHSFKGEG